MKSKKNESQMQEKEKFIAVTQLALASEMQMPITHQAKEGAYKQVRKAIETREGKCSTTRCSAARQLDRLSYSFIGAE